LHATVYEKVKFVAQAFEIRLSSDKIDPFFIFVASIVRFMI